MPKYLDLNTSYKLMNGQAQAVITDIKAICQDLTRLFKTPKGSVPFNRAYGTSLRNLLFENNLNPADIIVFLYQDITDFEPRVELNPSDIVIQRSDVNTYVLTCNFTVPSLNYAAAQVELELADMTQEAKDNAFLESDETTLLENIYGKDKIYTSYEYKKANGIRTDGIG